jgi:hypothetical protein
LNAAAVGGNDKDLIKGNIGTIYEKNHTALGSRKIAKFEVNLI